MERIISLCFLFLVHLGFLLLYYEAITQGILIIFLYLTNFLLILMILKFKGSSDILEDCDFIALIAPKRSTSEEEISNEKPTKPIEKPVLYPCAKESPPTSYNIGRSPKIHPSIKEKSPTDNLFIQRWLKNNVNTPQQFPLDRLSFLCAKYFRCRKESSFTVKNSHLKRLVKKPDCRPHDQFEDDFHPDKLINDSCFQYIHRRAVFYRNRKATLSNRKQTTAFRISEESEEHKPKITLSFLEGVLADRLAENSSASSEEAAEVRKPSIWRRISRAFTRSRPVKKVEESDSDEF